MKIFMFLILTSSLCFSADGKTPPLEFIFPPDIQVIIDKCTKGAKESHDKISDLLIKELNDKLSEKAKEGNLDAALAIKSVMKKYENGKLLSDLVNKEISDRAGNGGGMNVPGKKSDKLDREDSALSAEQKLLQSIEKGSITSAEWERFNLPVVKVLAQESKNTGIIIKDGEQYMIIPNPDDKWSNAPSDVMQNYLGNKGKWPGEMKLTAYVDRAKISGYLVGGPGVSGKLYLGVFFGSPSDNSGFIRVKIARVK